MDYNTFARARKRRRRREEGGVVQLLPNVVSATFNVSISSSTVNVSVPEGVEDGDLLIAEYVSDTSLATVPTGWEPGPFNILVPGTRTYWRVADNEPSSYNFTGSSASYAVGSIMKVENGNIYGPFEFDVKNNTDVSVSRSVPGIIASYEETLLLLYTDGPTLFTIPENWEKVAGNNYTQYEHSRANVIGQVDTWQAAHNGAVSNEFSAFMFGVVPEDINSYNDITIHSVAHNVSGGTSTTVSKPVETTNGDILVALVNSDHPTESALPGWNRGPSSAQSVFPKATWFWKEANEEPASYTPTVSGGGYVLACILRVTGVNTIAPFEVANLTTAGSDGGAGRPNDGIIAPRENSMLLVYSDGTSATTSPEGWSFVSGTTGSNIQGKVAGARGPTGAISIGQVTPGFYYTHMVALRPSKV